MILPLEAGLDWQRININRTDGQTKIPDVKENVAIIANTIEKINNRSIFVDLIA